MQQAHGHKRGTVKNHLRFRSAWWMGDVGGMVLEEFLNIFLYLFIMFLLNGIQTSTDRIFRLAVPALLAASSHKFMNIIYNEHIGTKLRQNASFVRLDVQLVSIICNIFPAIPQLFQWFHGCNIMENIDTKYKKHVGNPIGIQWFQEYSSMENAETKCIKFTQQSHRDSMI